jgi:hypothetical protein
VRQILEGETLEDLMEEVLAIFKGQNVINSCSMLYTFS